MAHGDDAWHRGLNVPKGRFQETGRFGRKFPHLRSLKSFTEAHADTLGSIDGPMDGGQTSADNPRIPAGFTFLGQFIDHDLTFDPTSSLEQQNDPMAIRNFRTPAFELDSVYGQGPKVQPYLYDPDAEGLLLISSDGFDLQRNWKDTALIGDPRNDENMLIGQLHLAFLRFHNAVRSSKAMSFEEAQTTVRWHYQWIVLNQFLRLTCGDDAVDEALARVPSGPTFAAEAFMPVEFAVAAYRFGHSQVRGGYQINSNIRRPIFKVDPGDPPPTADMRMDLRGGPVGRTFAVDWAFFFGDASTVQLTNKIDTKLAGPLFGLPGSVVPQGPTSLAVRNLRRGISFGLPAGETIAEYYGIAPLTPEQVGPEARTEGGTPLWFYILKEAEVLADGQRLAGVGARIVAEVFVDLLRMDTASFLASDPDWKPTLSSANKGDFLITDLLAIADGSVAP